MHILHELGHCYPVIILYTLILFDNFCFFPSNAKYCFAQVLNAVNYGAAGHVML